MAVSPGLLHCTFNTRLGGSEIALFGFHLELLEVEGVNHGMLEAVAEKARDEWLGAWGSLTSLFSPAVVFESVRIDHLDPQPGLSHLHVTDSAFSSFGTTGPTAFAGSGSNSGPWSSSVVVSYAAYSPGEFAVNKGRYRGRYYLPPFNNGMATGATGELSETNTQAVATAAGNFHEALNDLVSETLDDQLQLVVLSRADDTARRVEQVWVDSKLDTQRRRENRQKATQRKVVLLDA